MKIDEKQVTCPEQREGKKVLASQKMALTRIIYQNSTVKVPYSCWCLAGLMGKITELTTYWIQAHVLLTWTSSRPLETGSMCLRLRCHLASPGTINSGQVLLYQTPHLPDQPWAGGPFGVSVVHWSPYPFPTLFLIRLFYMIAPWFLLFFWAGTRGVEDLHDADITVHWELPLHWAHWHRDQGRDVRCKQHPSWKLESAISTKKPLPMTTESKPGW